MPCSLIYLSAGPRAVGQAGAGEAQQGKPGVEARWSASVSVSIREGAEGAELGRKPTRAAKLWGCEVGAGSKETQAVFCCFFTRCSWAQV